MTPRQIIAEAWAITCRERCLHRWGFFSAFFETLLNVKLLSYQGYFLWEYVSGKGTPGFFDVEIAIYHRLPLWFFLTFVLTFAVLVVVEWFVPHLALGAIIGLAAKSHKGEPVKGGLVLALYNFFPLFVIHEFLVFSGWAITITLCSLIIRYIPGEVRVLMIGFVLLFFVLSNVLKFFFSFAQPAVVIQKAGIFEAMGQSFKLIVSYLSHVMFLILLLFVISLRITLNAAIVLLLPGLVFGLVLLFTLILSPTFSYLIGGIVGTALIVATSYFFGYLHVFQETVWTITYMELKKHKDLDMIGS